MNMKEMSQQKYITNETITNENLYVSKTQESRSSRFKNRFYAQVARSRVMQLPNEISIEIWKLNHEMRNGKRRLISSLDATPDPDFHELFIWIFEWWNITASSSHSHANTNKPTIPNYKISFYFRAFEHSRNGLRIYFITQILHTSDAIAGKTT